MERTTITILFITITTTLFLLNACTLTEPTIIKDAPPSFLTEEMCYQSGCEQCGYAMCDYVPEGKTFEEVCGKNFQKGWQCLE
jgi:hypothetical protein